MNIKEMLYSKDTNDVITALDILDVEYSLGMFNRNQIYIKEENEILKILSYIDVLYDFDSQDVLDKILLFKYKYKLTIYTLKDNHNFNDRRFSIVLFPKYIK